MKKKYETPEMGIVEVELQQQFLAGSGFAEGETGSSGTGSGTIDPGEALSLDFGFLEL